MDRILYFVHYNKYNGLSDHVLYLLRTVRLLYTKVMVISNSPLSGEQSNKLSEVCDEILIRENKGFDFGAWKDAILKDGWEKLASYDNLTLMNDTCFGPLFDLEMIYLKMEQKDIDFWGLTNYRKDKHGIHAITKPADHIQSYFLCFNKNVINSDPFKIFWWNVKYKNRVGEVIRNYETRFTRILVRSGFRYSVILDKAAFPNIEPDHLIAFSRPDLCLKFRIPFLKIKSFLYFPHPKYIIKLLRENTNYPVSAIFDYFNQIYNPDTTLFIQDKLVDDNINKIDIVQNTKIAIHLYIYYIDILDKYMFLFNNIDINFDFLLQLTAWKREILFIIISKIRDVFLN
jgi:rhamnosyltransferase